MGLKANIFYFDVTLVLFFTSVWFFISATSLQALLVPSNGARLGFLSTEVPLVVRTGFGVANCVVPMLLLLPLWSVWNVLGVTTFFSGVMLPARIGSSDHGGEHHSQERTVLGATLQGMKAGSRKVCLQYQQSVTTAQEADDSHETVSQCRGLDVPEESSARRIQEAWHQHRRRKQHLTWNARDVAWFTTRRIPLSGANIRPKRGDLGSPSVVSEKSSESLNVTKATSKQTLPMLLGRVMEQTKTFSSCSSIGDEILQEEV